MTLQKAVKEKMKAVETNDQDTFEMQIFTHRPHVTDTTGKFFYTVTLTYRNSIRISKNLMLAQLAVAKLHWVPGKLRGRQDTSMILRRHH